MKRMTWIVVGWLVLGGSAQAASFDCAKAQSKVEHLICDNPEISKLDEELNAAYKAALQDEKQADTTMQAQKQWMKERNGCADAACVKQVYESRLYSFTVTPLPSIDVATAKHDSAPRAQEKIGTSSRLELLKGKGVEVCDIYKRNLDALGNSDLSCEREISPEYGRLLKKVVWKPMDVWENRNLMALAGKFLDYGDAGEINTVYDDQANIDATAKVHGARLKGVTMMTALIDIDNDGVDEKVLRFQNGICGLARFTYTTAILVLGKEINMVDAKKSQLLYPFTWLNPATGRREPAREYHYATYDVFSFEGNTYFDRMTSSGLLSVYKVSNDSNEEVCKFKRTVQ